MRYLITALLIAGAAMCGCNETAEPEWVYYGEIDHYEVKEIPGSGCNSTDYTVTYYLKDGKVVKDYGVWRPPEGIVDGGYLYGRESDYGMKFEIRPTPQEMEDK